MKLHCLGEKMDISLRKHIEPPNPKKEKALVRGIVEGLVEIVPGGGVLTKIASVTHPSEVEQIQEAWQANISERTNDNTTRINQHENLLQPHQEIITGTMAKLVHHLAHACPDGLGQEYFTLTEMLAMLPNENSQEVEDAVYELEFLGLVKVSRALSRDWFARLTQDFYEKLDHQIMGWNTEDDAVTIVHKMIEYDEGDAPTLHKLTGWEKRRFNPAFSQVLRLFPESRIRKVSQPDYPSLGVCMIPEDKVRMRRFVRR